MWFIILLLTATVVSAAEPLPERFCDSTPRIMAQVQALGLASQGKSPEINGKAYEMFKGDSELVTLKNMGDGQSCVFTTMRLLPKRYQNLQITPESRAKILCQPADDVHHRILSSGFVRVAQFGDQNHGMEFFDDGVLLLIAKHDAKGNICMEQLVFDVID